MATELVTRHFDQANGLSVNSIYDIDIAHNGMVWVASHNGLYRLASHKTRRIDVASGSTMFGDGIIRAVRELTPELLLVSTEHDLYLYYPNEERTEMLGVQRFGNFRRSSSIAISEISDNKLWLVNDKNELYRLDISAMSLRFLGVLPSGSGVAHTIVHHDQQVIIASRERLIGFDLEQESFHSIPWSKDNGRISSMFVDDHQQLWLSGSEGVFLQQGDAFTLLAREFGGVRSIEQGPQGMLWMLGQRHLLKVNPDTKELTTLGDHDKFFAESNSLYKLQLDPLGNIWLATLNAGVVVMEQPEPYILAKYNSRTEPSLSNELVWSTWGDENGFYVAHENGLDEINFATGERITHQIRDLDNVDAVFGLMPVGKDQLLLGTSKGLFLWNRQDYSHRLLVTENGESMRQRVILGLQQGKDSIWVSTDTFFYRFDKASGQVERVLVDGKPIESVRVAYELGDTLWIGGMRRFGELSLTTGAYQDRLYWLPDTNEQYHIGNIIALSDERLLIGSYGEGVFEVDIPKQQAVNKDIEWQVNCRTPFSMLASKEGAIIGCLDQILLYQPEKHQLIPLGDDRGLHGLEVSEGALFEDKQGILWLGSTSGLWKLDPSLIEEEASQGQLLIESVQVQYPQRSRLYLSPGREPVVIEPNYSLVTIGFGVEAISDANGVPVRYRLNLNGKEAPFVEIHDETAVNLSQLPAGKHQLVLQGQVNGAWYPKLVTLDFEVQQYWWQSRGIQILSILLILALALLLTEYWRNQLRRQRQINDALKQSQHRLQLALQGSGSDIWEWDASSDSFYIENRQSTLSHSTRPMRLPRKGMNLHRYDRDAAEQAWNAIVNGEQQRLNVEFRVISPLGEWRWLWVSGTAIERDLDTGKAKVIAGVFTDKTNVRQMAHQHTLYAHAVENTSEGMLIIDEQGLIGANNASAVSILGYSVGELIGRPAHQLLHDSEVIASLQQKHNWGGELDLKTRAGGTVPVWLNLSRMTVDDGDDYYVALFSDISERKKREIELKQLANYDRVTGLPNRSYFDKLMKGYLVDGNTTQLALLFLDLDRFKHINDTFGHGTGDALLQEISSLLAARLDDAGTLCRFGGDEFVVVVPDVASKEQVMELAQGLINCLERPIKVRSQQFYLSVSIGVACYPEHGQQAEELLKNADLAMYHAKEQGRGQVCCYTPDKDAKATYQLEMETELRQALALNALDIHFQPVLDVTRGKVVAVEALMRWRREDGQQVSPQRFIELAESSGLIIALDRWMLKQACRQFVKWPSYDEMTLSVNVSASHFCEHNYVEVIKQTLQQVGMDPRRLCLEITEGVLMQQVGLAKDHLKALRELGVRVAVDDFGTGYSSLAYLSQFAVTSLKIDRSFIQSMLENKANRAITCSILDLGRNLELSVIAEGVETLAQQQFLIEQGCHFIQGFRFARPMPEPQCLAWIEGYSENKQMSLEDALVD
ncbi:EAL domain-containing protein [Ferrimonas aestuarii]|uniref:EAL domain-containing protein n=1 Tax=Ferrimonas aestuarii TaxID=2569539 RepID=A0A4U1BNK3_9GAMM|nr:EAL domain-containing protein [Ferrimonas aestuarii]TKB53701.1 EAL domain-containing protein [Ferrimonas aestuarii]